MSDSDPQSPPAPREGFERRWIKNANYNGPERRSGADRRRYPPPKDGETQNSGDPTGGSDDPPTTPAGSGNFKPYRP